MWALRDVQIDLGLVSRQHRRGQGSAYSVAIADVASEFLLFVIAGFYAGQWYRRQR